MGKRIKRSRLFATSDSHGYYEEFMRLLKKVRFDWKRDKLIHLGDAIDRGPDSAKLLRKLMEMNLNGQCEFILGNHEVMFLDVIFGKFPIHTYFENGGLATFKSFGIDMSKNPTFEEIRSIIGMDLINWLLKRPLYYETQNYIFVHAGLNPDVPLENQTVFDLLSRSDFYKRYKGDKKVIFGHVPVQKIHKKNDIWVRNNCIGIDTGAGGKRFMTIINCDNLKSYRVRVMG